MRPDDHLRVRAQVRPVVHPHAGPPDPGDRRRAAQRRAPTRAARDVVRRGRGRAGAAADHAARGQHGGRPAARRRVDHQAGDRDHGRDATRRVGRAGAAARNPASAPSAPKPDTKRPDPADAPARPGTDIKVGDTRGPRARQEELDRNVALALDREEQAGEDDERDRKSGGSGGSGSGGSGSGSGGGLMGRLGGASAAHNPKPATTAARYDEEEGQIEADRALAIALTGEDELAADGGAGRMGDAKHDGDRKAPATAAGSATTAAGTATASTATTAADGGTAAAGSTPSDEETRAAREAEAKAKREAEDQAKRDERAKRPKPTAAAVGSVSREVSLATREIELVEQKLATAHALVRAEPGHKQATAACTAARAALAKNDSAAVATALGAASKALATAEAEARRKADKAVDATHLRVAPDVRRFAAYANAALLRDWPAFDAARKDRTSFAAADQRARIEEGWARFAPLAATLEDMHRRLVWIGTQDANYKAQERARLAQRTTLDDAGLARLVADIGDIVPREKLAAEAALEAARSVGGRDSEASDAAVMAKLDEMMNANVIRRGQLNRAYLAGDDELPEFSVEWTIGGLSSIVIHAHCKKDGEAKPDFATHWKPKGVKRIGGRSHPVSPELRQAMLDTKSNKSAAERDIPQLKPAAKK
ncbi:MAG: hypothetical protein U1F43_22095 [Myxococcota bacterium]